MALSLYNLNFSPFFLLVFLTTHHLTLKHCPFRLNKLKCHLVFSDSNQLLLHLCCWSDLRLLRVSMGSSLPLSGKGSRFTKAASRQEAFPLKRPQPLLTLCPQQVSGHGIAFSSGIKHLLACYRPAEIRFDGVPTGVGGGSDNLNQPDLPLGYFQMAPL